MTWRGHAGRLARQEMKTRPLTKLQKRSMLCLLSKDWQTLDGRTARGLRTRGLVVVQKVRGQLSVWSYLHYCALTHKGRMVAYALEAENQ